MSKYTTGEIAKLCGVTVRTVQYYDDREILIPSALSEGGRRLYSEEDLRRMKIICFLRDLGLSINAIRDLLAETHPEKVIDLLLQQQELELKAEIQSRQEKLDKLAELERAMKSIDHFSVESIGDVAQIMENKKKMQRVRWTMLAMGLVSETVEITTVLLWVLKGIWWPFACIGLPVIITVGVFLSCYYVKNVAYICPECHRTFVSKFKEMFWANHTLTTRKLTCPHCGHKGFCVEIYGRNDAS